LDSNQTQKILLASVYVFVFIKFILFNQHRHEHSVGAGRAFGHHMDAMTGAECEIDHNKTGT